MSVCTSTIYYWCYLRLSIDSGQITLALKTYQKNVFQTVSVSTRLEDIMVRYEDELNEDLLKMEETLQSYKQQQIRFINLKFH